VVSVVRRMNEVTLRWPG